MSQDHLEWALQAGWLQRSLVVALVVVVLVVTAFNLRRVVSRRRRLLLWGLRALTVASLGVVWLQPTWVSSNPRPGEQNVAVLLDKSLSMAQGKSGKRRYDQALAALRGLSGRQPVQWFVWSDRLERQPSLEALERGEPSVPRSDLLQALASLLASTRPGSL